MRRMADGGWHNGRSLPQFCPLAVIDHCLACSFSPFAHKCVQLTPPVLDSLQLIDVLGRRRCRCRMWCGRAVEFCQRILQFGKEFSPALCSLSVLPEPHSHQPARGTRSPGKQSVRSVGWRAQIAAASAAQLAPAHAAHSRFRLSLSKGAFSSPALSFDQAMSSARRAGNDCARAAHEVRELRRAVVLADSALTA